MGVMFDVRCPRKRKSLSPSSSARPLRYRARIRRQRAPGADARRVWPPGEEDQQGERGVGAETAVGVRELWPLRVHIRGLAAGLWEQGACVCVCVYVCVCRDCDSKVRWSLCVGSQLELERWVSVYIAVPSQYTIAVQRVVVEPECRRLWRDWVRRGYIGVASPTAPTATHR